MGYYKDLDVKRQEEEFEAHEFAADCAEELWDPETDMNEPSVGSWAETARAMSDLFPDFDWDAWKDEMKESEQL